MKMPKKIIISGVVIITILGVMAGWYALPSFSRGCSPFVGGAGSPASLYFSEALQNGFIERKGGRPIEGFQPFMFMEAYPGLGASDFNCVEEYDGGVYIFKDEQLTLTPKNTTKVSSAEGAITPRGMNQLLQNVATHHHRPFPRTNAEVDYLINVIVVYLPNQKTPACPSIPNGSVQTVRETTRLFINIPKDAYPDKERNLQFKTVSGSATSGYISNGGLPGEAFESTSSCWSYYNEFDGIGEVDLTVKSAMKDRPDYFVRFIVVPTQ